jgi:hypothetical protein
LSPCDNTVSLHQHSHCIGYRLRLAFKALSLLVPFFKLLAVRTTWHSNHMPTRQQYCLMDVCAAVAAHRQPHGLAARRSSPPALTLAASA